MLAVEAFAPNAGAHFLHAAIQETGEFVVRHPNLRHVHHPFAAA
jgi:hypothetical protein